LFRTAHHLHRLALHCISLTVPHPDAGTLAVTCPLADDIAQAIESLRSVQS